MPSTIKVEIKRQSTPDAPATTETFEVPYRPNMNITSLLGVHRGGDAAWGVHDVPLVAGVDFLTRLDAPVVADRKEPDAHEDDAQEHEPCRIVMSHIHAHTMPGPGCG